MPFLHGVCPVHLLRTTVHRTVLHEHLLRTAQHLAHHATSHASVIALSTAEARHRTARVQLLDSAQTLRDGPVERVNGEVARYTALAERIGLGVGAGLLALALVGLLGAAFLVRTAPLVMAGAGAAWQGQCCAGGSTSLAHRVLVL